MKIIKIDTQSNVTVIDINDAVHAMLRQLIGDSIEHVRPKRLPQPYCMIVDEEGLLKNLPFNTFGSYLYQTDLHGQPIAGDILLMKDVWAGFGYDIVGLTDEDIAFLGKQFTQLKL